MGELLGAVVGALLVGDHVPPAVGAVDGAATTVKADAAGSDTDANPRPAHACADKFARALSDSGRNALPDGNACPDGFGYSFTRAHGFAVAHSFADSFTDSFTHSFTDSFTCPHSDA